MPKVLGPFWSYVDKSNSCWLWTGSIGKDGYGTYGDNKRAHVAIWELHTGQPIAPGMEVHHKCRNKICVNTGHLEEVTHYEHLHKYGNSTKTHCPRGHEYSPENTYINNGRRVCKTCKAYGKRFKPRRIS